MEAGASDGQSSLAADLTGLRGGLMGRPLALGGPALPGSVTVAWKSWAWSSMWTRHPCEDAHRQATHPGAAGHNTWVGPPAVTCKDLQGL